MGLNFVITKKEELVAQRSSINPGHPAADPPPKTAVQILHDKT